MDVKCINTGSFDILHKSHPDLTCGNTYFVIGIEGDYYRLLGDLGFPYLYHKSRFDIVNPHPEPDWKYEKDERGIDTWYPEPLRIPDIFEEFFRGNRQARHEILFYAQKLVERRRALIYDQQLVEGLIGENKPL